MGTGASSRGSGADSLGGRQPTWAGLGGAIHVGPRLRRCFNEPRRAHPRASHDDPDAAGRARLPDPGPDVPSRARVDARRRLRRDRGTDGHDLVHEPADRGADGLSAGAVHGVARLLVLARASRRSRARGDGRCRRGRARRRRTSRSTAWSSRRSASIWVRDEAVHVDASKGRAAHWIGLIVDITREKEAEARAAEVEHRYRTLIEQLPIVTYIDAPDESLANLFVSPQINDLLGRPSGSTGEEWAERVHPGGPRPRAERDGRGCPIRRAVHARVPDGARRRTGDLGPRLGDHRARRRRRSPSTSSASSSTSPSGRRRSSSSRRSSAGTATSSSSCRPSRTWTRPTTSCPRST